MVRYFIHTVYYKKELLDYMLCGCCPYFFPPSKSLIFTPILSYGFAPLSYSLSAVPSFRWGWGGVGWETSGRVGFECASLRRCIVILAWNIYCAKPNPEADAQSGSRVRKGLRDRAPWSTREHELATAISIRPLTQNLTCEMGSSIFAAMGRLKVASATSSSLPIIPSTERINGEKCFRWS